MNIQWTDKLLDNTVPFMSMLFHIAADRNIVVALFCMFMGFYPAGKLLNRLVSPAGAAPSALSKLP